MRKTRKIIKNQSKLDNYLKYHYCQWCSKKFTNPSSLSLHRLKCSLRPVQYDIDSALKTYNSGLKHLQEILKRLKDTPPTNIIQEIQKSRFNETLETSYRALKKALDLGGINSNDYQKMLKDLKDIHVEFLSMLDTVLKDTINLTTDAENTKGLSYIS